MGRGTGAKAAELGEDEPDPMSGFVVVAEFGEDLGVNGGLGGEEALEIVGVWHGVGSGVLEPYRCGGSRRGIVESGVGGCGLEGEGLAGEGVLVFAEGLIVLAELGAGGEELALVHEGLGRHGLFGVRAVGDDETAEADQEVGEDEGEESEAALEPGCGET